MEVMSKSDLASVKLTCFRDDVYEPSDDSFLLADTLLELSRGWPSSPPKVCLEVGCGSGYVVCSLARILHRLGISCEVLATDVNPAAVAATAATLAAHCLPHGAELSVTDLAAALQPRLNGTVDLLLFNPPYVPTPDEEVSRGGIAAAWAGGERGRRVMDRLLPLVPQLLSPRGEMLLITVPDNDVAELLSVMADQGFEGRVAAERAADEEKLQVLHFWRRRQPLVEDVAHVGTASLVPPSPVS